MDIFPTFAFTKNLNGMENLREWAEFYYTNGIAIYPSCANRWEVLEAYPWKQTLEAVQTFNWEGSQWVGGIAGVANVSLIKLSLKRKELQYIFKVVTRLLYLLNLYNYPWVIIDKDDTVFVLLRCNCKYIGEEGFDSLQIISKGFYELPCNTDKVESGAEFFFNAVPSTAPSTVKYEDVLTAIGCIIEEFGLFLDRG